MVTALATSGEPSRHKVHMYGGLLAALFFLAISTSLAAEPLRLLSEHLTPEGHSAFDLRWVEGDSEKAGKLLLALGTDGVVEFDATEPEQYQLVLAGDRRPEVGFFYTTRLAVSETHMVASAPFGGLTWVDLHTGRRGPDFGQRAIVDVDLHQDRVLLLGVRSGDEGEWAPDGAIAWLGSLKQNLEDLRPVMYSETPHAEGMALCPFFDHGAARFLDDGSFLIVPGTEPGIFLYNANGQLQHTWDANPAGIDVGCGPSTAETSAQFARDWRLRHSAFFNRYRVLQDILILPQGPALLVRHTQDGVTRWQLNVLTEGKAEPDILELPIESTTGLAHLHGDARNGVLAFGLMAYRGMEGPPPEPSRVFLVEVPVESSEP